MARHGNCSFGGGFQRKPVLWSGFGSGVTAFSSTATSILASLPLSSPGTVMRILGGWWAQPTPGGTFVAGDKAEIAIGVGVVSADAAAAGSAAVPQPITDEGWPWLYWKSFTVLIDAAVAESSESSGVRIRHELDIKSMRKFKSNMSLVVVGQYLDQVGTPPMTV